MFRSNIICLNRLIDDMFCIWTGSVSEFGKFKEICNNFGVLKWEFKPLSHHVEFLDLNVTLNKGNFHTYTYEKPHNLFLYIPYSSSYSSYCKKLLIWSLLYRFYHLNDHEEDYISQVYKLYNRLRRRGYPAENTKAIMQLSDF